MKRFVSGVQGRRKAVRGRSGRLPELQHLPLYGSFEKLCGVRDPDFLHHIGPMCLNSLDADFQPLGDFLIFESSPYQLEDFLFAGRQGFRTSLTRRK